MANLLNNRLMCQLLTRCLVFLLIIFHAEFVSAQVSAIMAEPERRWIDSVYNSLSMQQRIGQLFILRANSETDSSEIRSLSRLIKTYNIGGLCFFKGGPVRQAILTNYYQNLAQTPMLITMVAEWGLGMRLDSTISFPRQMTLGALQDESLISKYGFVIARQLKRMGVHMSFSPVADINNNSANPVINIRSFGEHKDDVSRKATLYMKALQKGGILTVAKHFPGHGDTDTDSHHALPYIGHSRTTIDTLDLFPFKTLVNEGVDGVMVAHLNIPALDTGKDIPSSLSKPVIDSLLRDKLNFKGLVLSDALDMKGVSGYDNPGFLELRALQAGNDALLLSVSVEKTVAVIMQAIDSGIYSEKDLELHCKRLLSCKYRAGLNNYQPIRTENLVSDLHTYNDLNFNLELYRSAVTLIKNEKSIIPLLPAKQQKIATLMIGYENESVFQKRINDYSIADHFMLPRNFDSKRTIDIVNSLSNYDLVIIGINNTIPAPARNFGISASAISLVDSLLITKPCILNLFTLPYSANLFKNINSAKAILISYQDNPDAYNALVQVLFGAYGASGKTPVGINSDFPAHTGLKTAECGRLSYDPNELFGISISCLASIDSVVNVGLSEKAYPGCQVLIAKNGNVFYRKAFGNQDYFHNRAVKNDDIYDLASITKVAATTLAVMRLYDQGKVHLDEPLSKTLKYLENSNKKKITVREVLTHQAGLVAWIPFYKKTLVNGLPDSNLYAPVESELFPYRVAEGLFLRKDYRQKILDSIIKSPVSNNKEYKYSDLGFILMQQYIEKITGKSLDDYVNQEFYKPLGLSTLVFHPLEHFPVDRIIPTENDTVFRHQLIHGYVHDPAAAMLGGVAGHAGLFGTVNDMAVLMQMLIQDGMYGGQQFLKPETVALFTAYQYAGNRRGLGFDKPQLNRLESGPACKEASGKSFGHTGFTGTYVWADPDNDLIIVFLSNRVNPDAEPNKLVKLGIRTQIQEILYKGLYKN